MNARENGLLYALQCGLPLEARPLARIGAPWGYSETDTAKFITRLVDEGAARRFGAVFDGRRMGYQSALCALDLPINAQLEKAAAAVSANPGVTHCYERGWPAELDPGIPGGPRGARSPNLWFTLMALQPGFAAELHAIREALRPAKLLVMPARKRFKIEAVFDPRDLVPGMHASVPLPPACAETWDDEPAPEFTERERAVVRLFQGHVPPVPDLFARAADRLAMPLEDLLALLRSWQRRGILRRVALMVRHKEIGFKANGMGAWRVPQAEVASAGRRLAARAEVTHCYERPALPEFRRNLFAMLHTGAWNRTALLFQELSQAARLKEGVLLCSLREFKKVSMQYFSGTA